jgi:hypothetical protein
MEHLIKKMQDTTQGVPVKPQKLFLTIISNAFTGYLLSNIICLIIFFEMINS